MDDDFLLIFRGMENLPLSSTLEVKLELFSLTKTLEPYFSNKIFLIRAEIRALPFLSILEVKLIKSCLRCVKAFTPKSFTFHFLTKNSFLRRYLKLCGISFDCY